jgi:NAD(P)-dependent dehydrogenase (short-subunit alcohol dehydrogenase family)
MEFLNKVVVVTGGAKGIGKAIVKAYSDQGAKVNILDVDEEEGRRTAEEYDNVHFYNVDITNYQEVQKAANEIQKKVGAINILINNAGISNSKTTEDLEIEDWSKIIAVNLTGSFHCTKAVIEQMKEAGGGKIINIASVGGIRISYSGGIAYTASKSGLIGLTRHLAYELIPYGINVNCICPGGTLTPLYESLTDEELLEKRISMIPAGRLCEPEDIAGSVLFLTSEQAKMICGATIPVDGGSLLGWLNIKDYYAKRKQ